MSENTNIKHQIKSSVVVLIAAIGVVIGAIIGVIGFSLYQNLNKNSTPVEISTSQVATTEEATTQEITTIAPTTAEPTTEEPTTKAPETEPPTTEEPTTISIQPQDNLNQKMVLYEAFDRTDSYIQHETEKLFFESENIVRYTGGGDEYEAIQYSISGNELTIYNFPWDGAIQNFTYTMNFEKAFAAHGEYLKLYLAGEGPLAGEWSGTP